MRWDSLREIYDSSSSPSSSPAGSSENEDDVTIYSRSEEGTLEDEHEGGVSPGPAARPTHSTVGPESKNEGLVEGREDPSAKEESDGGKRRVPDGIDVSLKFLQPDSPPMLMDACLQFLSQLVLTSPALNRLFFRDSRGLRYIHYGLSLLCVSSLISLHLSSLL